MIDLTNTTSILTVMGFLAFIVSAITQVTKEIGFLKKIPTSLQVTFLSVILTLLYYLAYVSYNRIVVQWYMVVGSIVAGFLVAFVTMFGWEKFYDMYSRFTNK